MDASDTCYSVRMNTSPDLSPDDAAAFARLTPSQRSAVRTLLHGAAATKDAPRPVSDDVATFIAERLRHCPNLSVSVAAVYDAYVSWHDINSSPLSKRSLSRALLAAGFRHHPNHADGRCWADVMIIGSV